ncbi:MAG: hypothetical protein HOO96_44540 [Polyangiaceae bacterium]|nr:hypothetical protein [Polyangiaceae bacterium]
MNDLPHRVSQASLRISPSRWWPRLAALLTCSSALGVSTAGCAAADVIRTTTESDGAAPPSGEQDGGSGSDGGPVARKGSATVTSNLLGGAYVPQDAVVTIDKHASTSVPGTFVEDFEVYIIDRPALCAAMRANQRPAGGTRLKIEIEKRGATPEAAVLAAGTYELVTDATTSPAVKSKIEGSTYFANDAGTCSSTDVASLDKIARADLAKNDLLLATVSATGVTGSFDLTFKDGRFVRGTFDAPACDDSGKPAGATACK